MQKTPSEVPVARLLTFPPYAKKILGQEALDCLELLVQQLTLMEEQVDTSHPRQEWMPELKARGFFKDLRILQVIANKMIENFEHACAVNARIYGPERGRAKALDGATEILTGLLEQAANLNSPLTTLCLEELFVTINIRRFADTLRELRDNQPPRSDPYHSEKFLYSYILTQYLEREEKSLWVDPRERRLFEEIFHVIFWLRHLSLKVKGRYLPGEKVKTEDTVKQTLKKLRYTEVAPFEDQILCRFEGQSKQPCESFGLRAGANMHPFNIVDVAINTGVEPGGPVPPQVNISLSAIHGDLVPSGYGYASLAPLFELYGEQDSHLHMKNAILVNLEESLAEGILKERDWLGEWEAREARETAVAAEQEEVLLRVAQTVEQPQSEPPANGSEPRRVKGRRETLNNIPQDDLIKALTGLGVEVRNGRGSHIVLQKGGEILVLSTHGAGKGFGNPITDISDIRRKFGITAEKLLDALYEL